MFFQFRQIILYNVVGVLMQLNFHLLFFGVNGSLDLGVQLLLFQLNILSNKFSPLNIYFIQI
jgi:hypothetical protein